MSEHDKEKLKTVLRRDGIKLWEPPYTSTDDLAPLPFPEELVERYAGELGLAAPIAAGVLDALRAETVDKLRAKRRFQETGLARLAVSEEGGSGPPWVELALTEPGRALYSAVAGADRDPFAFRLVAGGRVLDRGLSLAEQGLGNLSPVLVIPESEEALAEAAIARSARAAQLMASTGRGQLDLRSQDGRPIHLPRAENQAVILASILHEKGRRAIAAAAYTRALLFLLRADEHFRSCRADVLQATDNQSLLQLDIVWCYLKLNSVRHLPDAEARLAECQAGFHRVYGVSLERVARLKASVALEQGLVARLKLLQGILAFYKQDVARAQALLAEAGGLLRELTVEPGLVHEMLLMGYEEKEARLALRATRNSVPRAVAHIQDQRDAERAREVAEAAERSQRRLQRDLARVAGALGQPAGDQSMESTTDEEGGQDGGQDGSQDGGEDGDQNGGEDAAQEPGLDDEALMAELERDLASLSPDGHLDLTFQEESDLLADYLQRLTSFA